LEQRLREKEGADSAAVVKASRPSAAERKRAAQSAAAAQAMEEVQQQEVPEPEEPEPYEEDMEPISPMSSKFMNSSLINHFGRVLIHMSFDSVLIIAFFSNPQIAVLEELNPTLTRHKKSVFLRKSFQRCGKHSQIYARLHQGFSSRIHSCR
jgi:hypothetical protein